MKVQGSGVVPAAASLLGAGLKNFQEVLAEGEALVFRSKQYKLAFTEAGCDPKEVKLFLAEVLQAGKKNEPTIETGNKYGVSSQFHSMNSELQMTALRNSPLYQALSPANAKRAVEMHEIVFRDEDMRNRNCLHPAMLDAAIIGNLLNFPKHIFGFPYGCHATDGNESLSLCLFSYRQACSSTRPVVHYVRGAGEDQASLLELEMITARLSMLLVVSLVSPTDTAHLAVVMTSIDHPALGATARWSLKNSKSVHVHVRDQQWRDIFGTNAGPVHYILPEGVRSISIEEGLLNSGFAVYKDLELRDRHLDLGYAWQTAYMSPNEGGSGGSAPLFSDFCTLLLGWGALGEIARGSPTADRSTYRLEPTAIQAGRAALVTESTFEACLAWAKASIAPDSAVPRPELEAELVCFQREFIGGKDRDVEALTSGGGTRSINLAFESVLTRARTQDPYKHVKVLTGNPHLAVERAERRFNFELVRLAVDGALDVSKLKAAIVDPEVRAVYAQTLSFTDGITDPLAAIVSVIEEENLRRKEEDRITLINDSCLAFSVLVHHPGIDGGISARVLDLTKGGVSPVVVMIDAHKHLGCDKGVSTIVGTPGTLSCLRGKVKVGANPPQADLARALANMRVVGVQGYYRLYHKLGAAVQKATDVIEAAGMRIVHKQHKLNGSTVISVESKSGAMIKALKQKGHAVGTLFNLCPDEPTRCQSGWQVSLTPHALRTVGGQPALDQFLVDVVDCHKALQASGKMHLAWRLCRENTLLPCLLAGDPMPFLFKWLNFPGFGRQTVQCLVRRFFTAQLDCGSVCSERRTNAFQDLLKRVLAALAIVVLLIKGKQLMKKLM